MRLSQVMQVSNCKSYDGRIVSEINAWSNVRDYADGDTVTWMVDSPAVAKTS